jgi:uncharacterized membrane protein
MQEATSDFQCPSCGERRSPGMRAAGVTVPPSVAAEIQQEHPQWALDDPICSVCVNKGKARVLAGMLAEQGSRMGPAEMEIVAQVRSDRPVSSDSTAAFEQARTRGERGADLVAGVVGSWRFSILLLLAIFSWLTLNLLQRPFEPYPMITLAVISATLGALAALQGPVILMSQRRQRRVERLQARNDYQVNLKAELEIRLLDEKLDRVLLLQQDLLRSVKTAGPTGAAEAQK